VAIKRDFELRNAERRWSNGHSALPVVRLLEARGGTVEAAAVARLALARPDCQDEKELEAALSRIAACPAGWGEALAAFAKAPTPEGWRELMRFLPPEYLKDALSGGKGSARPGRHPGSPIKNPPLPKLTIAEETRVHSFKSHQGSGIKDPARFGQLMDEAVKLVAPGAYLGDNLFTWMRNLSALEDSAFLQAWRSNVVLQADEAILWRRYILCCAACHCAHLPGDFVECGVLFGTGVKTVIDYFGKDNFGKQFWAYDVFEFNPVEGLTPVGQGQGVLERVRERFSGYDNVKIVAGLLPVSLDGNSPDEIAYLHIDLNNAESEIAVLERLFERVVPGGIVILDDYEWSGMYRKQKIKEDSWFEARQYRVIPLPTGQGLVLKR
jgi:O-methyltransferase